jgi:hypothetical protein
MATTAFRLFFGFFYRQFLTSDTGAVQGFDCPFCLGVIGHVHESEAFAFPGLSIEDNFCGKYHTIQFEHFF